jgi:hypothetical protein
MPVYTAEDIPSYLLHPDERRPMDDETAAMSAPVILGKGLSRVLAVRLIADRLHDSANMRHVQMAGESAMYRAAAAMFEASAHTHSDTGLTLRIWGRIYRIREENK